MAKKSRPSVLKRQREVRKLEKAAAKRERRQSRKGEGDSLEDMIAKPDDLDGLGFHRTAFEDE